MDNYQYPSVALSRRYTGDKYLSESYRGEANKLLYQLKNLMKFRQLGQLKMTRLFTDGTAITAWSIFGQDFINVDVSRTILGTGIGDQGIPGINECTVTFINLPISVQPMRYPGEIRVEEVEGIDYIKTYYSYDISNCPGCNNQSDFVFEFTFDDPPGIPARETTPPPINPDDHCIISQDGGCSGEVIDRGQDADGTYIRWKVYTESAHNRSGLAGVRITASIKDGAGTVICSVQSVVMVDCCLRDGILKPDIYWEFDGDVCIDYGVTTLCQVPSIMSLGLFGVYASGESGWAARYYAIPEVGGCPIYEWSISGPGSLYMSDVWGRMVTYLRPEGGEINGDVIITVTDRCGRSDSFLASCCLFASPLSIDYTSLLMSCSGQQTLTAIGGCGPYTWAVSGGGGSIEFSPPGYTAIYTAPATNVNCVNNPTIQVTDDCGTIAEIKFAVNCYTHSTALRYCDSLICTSCFSSGDSCWAKYIFGRWIYNCNGVLSSSTFWDGSAAPAFACRPEAAWTGCCTPLPICADDPTCASSGLCSGLCSAPNQLCKTLLDRRTTVMKEGGCCPINPLTGLPY